MYTTLQLGASADTRAAEVACWRRCNRCHCTHAAAHHRLQKCTICNIFMHNELMNQGDLRLGLPEGHAFGQFGGVVNEAEAHRYARGFVYVLIVVMIAPLVFSSGSSFMFYICISALVVSVCSLCASRLFNRMVEASLARQQTQHIPLNELGSPPLSVQHMARAGLSPFHSMRLSPNRISLGDILLLQSALLANRDFSHADFDALSALDQRNVVPQSRVTPPEVLAQLPTYPFRCRSGAAPIECPVCLELLKADETVRALPCCHSFHMHCIDPWLSSNHTCPVCKHDLLPQA
jgi:hypothetical protein